jgi:hypothetical protein
MLGDARDAVDTLDDVSEDDVRTAGTWFAVALGVLLALDAAIALVVFTQLMSGAYRRSRMVAALVGSVLVAAIAIALHALCRVAVWEANDEIGRSRSPSRPARTSSRWRRSPRWSPRSCWWRAPAVRPAYRGQARRSSRQDGIDRPVCDDAMSKVELQRHSRVQRISVLGPGQ